MFENKTLSFLENLQTFGWKLTLENIQALLNFLGNPHNSLKCVHIAGTNGKGSTAAILASILATAGYKTGLYTSPHLVEVNERIRIDGQSISDVELIRYINLVEDDVVSRQCTYFETLTAIAFKYFYDCDVDIVVIEVGLGGRFDATNIIDPILSVITEIDFDHEQHLGKDLSSIASEKAGIIKENRPCLVQTNKEEALAVFETSAKKTRSEFFIMDKICSISYRTDNPFSSEFDLTILQSEYTGLTLKIPGKIQVRNAALAICAAKLIERSGFPVSDSAVRSGLQNTVWPGRLQIIQQSPTILIDVAHNVASIKNLLDYINAYFPDKKVFFVVGLLADKNITGIVRLISQRATNVFAVTPASSRALSAQDLANEFRSLSVPVQIFTNFSQISDLGNGDDLICVTGSHYIVGELLKSYKKA